MKKRSFFERLSGSVPLEDDFDTFEEDLPVRDAGGRRTLTPNVQANSRASVRDDEPTGGHLPIDMHQTADEIIIRSFIAGVRADEINVSITRDMVTIEGSREAHSETHGPDVFHQELFWGSFSRTIMLPQEVDVDGAVAGAKDGLLTITLPKLDKSRQTKLKVRGN